MRLKRDMFETISDGWQKNHKRRADTTRSVD
jgi:hypothetical protein